MKIDNLGWFARALGVWAFLVYGAVLLTACPPEPVTPTPSPDGAAPVGPCAAACARLRDLRCPEGEPSPGGVSCEQVCAEVGELMATSCIVAAQDVPAIHRCSVRCVP
jgi:hypothetical protein